MKRTVDLIIRGGEDSPLHATLAELVMAWARETATGQPVYILELTQDRRGAKCGCECASCGLPLTAVNVAKKEFKIRPHFRHPNGAAKNECMFLAARLAALRLLTDQGVLELPRRRMSGQVVGLSGAVHEAWVELPAERVRIAAFNFHDRTAAILTLDDGRQLRVQLVGTSGTPVPSDTLEIIFPTILLEVSDIAVAAMAPEDLRRRLTLIPDSICWRNHWGDDALKASAEDQARREAEELLDWAPPDAEFMDGLDPVFRRETLLHLEVKRILAEAGEVWVPALSVHEQMNAPGGTLIKRQWERASCRIPLIDVKLEKRLGCVIPDVIAQVPKDHHDTLLIEVTVANQISYERLERIKSLNLPTLEIDLSRAGGRVTRSRLVNLVVQELLIKRWLHHPESQQQSTAMRGELLVELAEIQSRARQVEDRRQEILNTPTDEVGRRFVAAIFELAESSHDSGQTDFDSARQQAAHELLADAVKHLALHGFPEAGDRDFIEWHGILSRILSIQLDFGVGYRLKGGLEVLNAIRQSRHENRANHALYLIAARVYKPNATPKQAEWLDQWAAEVRESIKSGEDTYLRDPVYDRLLSMLFPEMAPSLAKKGGKREASDGIRRGTPGHSVAQPRLQPKSQPTFESSLTGNGTTAPLLDTAPSAGWLTGRDLDVWKKAHPSAARNYFGDSPKDG